MNPLMKRLFNSVRDGLLIVSREGITRYANLAGLRLIPCTMGAPLPNAGLQRLITSATSGHTPIPHETRVELGKDTLEAGADEIRAHLLNSPVGDDYVILLHNVTAEQFFRTGMRNLASLIHRLHEEDLRTVDESAQALLGRLSGAANEALTDDLESLRALVRIAGEHLGSIEKLAHLAELSGVQRLTGDDRIALPETLLAATQRLQPQAKARTMRLIVEKPETEPPPVYGSALWIQRVIDELLENAIKHGRVGSDISLQLRQNAGFVMLTVRNVGKAMSHTLQQRLTDEGLRGPAAQANKLAGLGLGLAICRQVIALHGGHLLTESQADESIEFAIELPTGAPHQDTAQLDLMQAQRYATDLARLMQRKRAPAPQT